ncbi:lipoate--protein ligase family protein [Saxibacter everestensis]|uniref:Lipoate--protein ligase family protein n=1 Tax=Saxibacter everestensis TaxID=2909229 RepID=A0ABY8QVP1_9MICO|nr:lipoate--protein ligase family protein [Brevibacteriaceae bacterium ZFBP1038]
MHGEYKVPGGKLVVVDLEVRDGRIDDFQLSGDFFLEPEEALDDINRAVRGAPADTDQATLASRIQAALRLDAELNGFTPDAVAIAVRRAIGNAADWRDFDWQIIHSPVLPTVQNVALDEVLAQEVAAGRRKPTVRFWEWEDKAVVIGSFQSVKNEVDPEGAARHGVQVTRRVSGGGAMFMEGGNCITYSLYFPSKLVSGLSFVDSYAYLDDWVLSALKSAGVEAWYVPINDITSANGKIGGAAQKRFGAGTVLHHVTMSYDIDADKMVEVLRIGKEKLSDKGHGSAKKRVDPLRRQTGMPREDIIERMIDTFVSRYGASADTISDHEMALAEKSVATKFGTREWTERVP